MAADVQYQFNGSTYPSLGAAEAAMRAAHPNWASSLHVCSVANGTNTATITYCTSPQAAQYWISNYSSPGIGSPGCTASTGPFTNYCNSEGMLVSALSARVANGTTTCLVGESESGFYASSPNAWATSYYSSGGSNINFADASYYSGQSTSRWVTFQTRACSAQSSDPTSASYYELRLDEAFQCPAGYTPSAGLPLSQFPFVCVGGSVTIIKQAAENVSSCPHTDHPCAPATGEKLLTETDFTWRGHAFQRMYASGHETPANAGMGRSWSDSWADSLIPPVPSPSESAQWRNGRNDLETFKFAPNSSTTMLSQSTPGRTLVLQTDGSWMLTDTSTTFRHFSAAGAQIGEGDVNDPAGQLAFAYENGQLATVTDGTGQSLTFGYNTAGQMATITDDASTVLASYGYDASGNLTAATYPDSKSRAYAYGESTHLCVGATGDCQAAYFSAYLTGVSDETGHRILDATYDESGRVVSSLQPSGSTATTLSYPTAGQTQVVESGQGTVLWTFTQDLYRKPASRKVYDGSRLVSTETWVWGSGNTSLAYTDPNGAVTTTTYNAAGLPVTEVDAQGKPEQRTIKTTWSTGSQPQPLTVTVANAAGATVRETSYAYNGRGQLTTTTVTDPETAATRTITKAYCESADLGTGGCALLGQLKSVTDARGNASAFAYRLTDATGCNTAPATCAYRKGDLYQVTDAAGHVRTINSVDAAGRVLRTTDTNGVITDLAYDPRGLLTSSTIRANADGTPATSDATTTLGYDATADVTSVTDPDGVTVRYGYDSSQRLTDITDALGNAVHYTLDAAGDRTGESVKDPAGHLARSLSRAFNTLGQLQTVVDGNAATVLTFDPSDGYDGAGHPQHTTDGLGVVRRMTYDALGRLTTKTDDVGGTDPGTANAQTAFAYDALDHLQGISDPSGLDTVYDTNAFGDALGNQSPDSGSTTIATDAAGNPLIRTDARGVTVTSTYDALNRVTSESYPDATLDVSYYYDEADAVTGCSDDYPIGRLTRIVEADGVATTYCYDRAGRVLRKTLTVAGATTTTQYGYTLAGRLSSMTYPSGAVLAYTRDGDGRISAATLTPAGGGAAQSLVSAVAYAPFGAVASYQLGSGQTVTRAFDANGRISAVSSAVLGLAYSRDVEGNVTGVSGISTATNGYGYDALQRLRVVTESTGSTLESYTYNQTGDRLSKTTSFQDGGAYGYASGTHHLSRIGAYPRTYAAAGDTLTASMAGEPFGFRYNARRRLDQVTRSGAVVGTYTYDALGQRVEKVTTLPAASTKRFGYNENSQLIAEQTNGAYREYVYIGHLPVAVIDSSAGVNPTTTISYLHDDALGTVRVATTSTGTTTWSWSLANNAFGEQQPVDTGGMGLNLRFPGQYYDAESGLSDNIKRTFDPARGGYIQPDPIWPNGGMREYAYVDSRPTGDIDPLGLESPRVASGCGAQLWSNCSKRPLAIPEGCGEGTLNPGLLATIVVTEILGGGPEDPIADAVVAEEIADAEGLTLYRGIGSDSPAFEDATQGIAVPRGGNASLLDHSLGNTESEFTSWTSDYEVALFRATNNGERSGVILTNTFPNGAAIQASESVEAVMQESEFLVRGRIVGASPKRVP